MKKISGGNLPSLDVQASILANYLVGKSASSQTIHLYKTALQKQSGQGAEDRLLKLAFSHPYLLPILDSGAAIASPHTELRRRLYIMFALLETTPEYSQDFLSRRTLGPLAWIKLVALSLMGLVQLILGVLLIKGLRLTR